MQKIMSYARYIALLAAIGLLVGCGQKGDLYLPQDTEQTQQ